MLLDLLGSVVRAHWPALVLAFVVVCALVAGLFFVSSAASQVGGALGKDR